MTAGLLKPGSSGSSGTPEQAARTAEAAAARTAAAAGAVCRKDFFCGSDMVRSGVIFTGAECDAVVAGVAAAASRQWECGSAEWSARAGVSGVCAASGFGFEEIFGGVDCGVVFGFCGGEVFIFACSEDVEFALGFGAAAADGDAHAVFEGEEVEIFFWDDIAVAVFDGIAAEVFEIDEFGAEEFADGILAEG